VNVNGTFGVDGLTLAGSYTLGAAAPSCFPASSSGTFSGSQIRDVTGNWVGIIQACSWDSAKRVCTNTGAAVQLSATLAQDDASATVTGTYNVTGLPTLSTFSNGSIGTQGQQLLSGNVLQLMWTDKNGTMFTMDARLGQMGQIASMSGVVIDAARNYYYFRMLQQ
jgi:hypothetical protein